MNLTVIDGDDCFEVYVSDRHVEPEPYPCPCGGGVLFAVIATEVPVLFHSDPPCEPFRRLDLHGAWSYLHTGRAVAPPPVIAGETVKERRARMKGAR